MPNAPPHQRPRGVPFGRLWVFLVALLCAAGWLASPPFGFSNRSAWAQDGAPPPAPLENGSENEAEQARGQPIGAIKVAGNRRITSDDIVAYLTEQVWQTFSPEGLAKDVRELWNSGFFDDIEVDLEREGGKVSLRFLVRERPNISAIEFEGNAEIDTEDLTEAI